MNVFDQLGEVSKSLSESVWERTLFVPYYELMRIMVS